MLLRTTREQPPDGTEGSRIASAQVGLFQAQPNQHRARHVRRTRGGAPECGLPSPRPEPRQKWSSQSTLNAEASPEEAQRFRSSFLHQEQSAQPVPMHKLELLARGSALTSAAALAPRPTLPPSRVLGADATWSTVRSLASHRSGTNQKTQV